MLFLMHETTRRYFGEKVRAAYCRAPGYAEEWRAVITAERMPSWGGTAFSMSLSLPPPVERDHHFCDMTCLAVWVSEAVPDAQEKLSRKLASREKAKTA